MRSTSPRTCHSQPVGPSFDLTVMRRSKGLTSWSWREGMVDVREEHIQLRFGDAAKSVYKQWLPVALVGKPRNQVFPVLWLISPDNPSHEEMIAAARKELDFYLLEKGEPDPWAYAKYHCNTAANVYSDCTCTGRISRREIRRTSYQ